MSSPRALHLACLALIVAAVLFAGCSDDHVVAPAETAGNFLAMAEKDFERPFADYVAAQGTYCWPDGEGGCVDFEPPLLNFLGWTAPGTSFNALFEYLGNAEIYLQEQSDGAVSLGTQITGRVIERPLDDGRAFIRVYVHASNILAWVTEVEDFYLDPLVFGTRVDDVLAGEPPALADFELKVAFILPEQDADLPDLFQLFLVPEDGQELHHVSATMCAQGVFHTGSGFPEGTQGEVEVMQVFQRPPSGDYAEGWLTESIAFRSPDYLGGTTLVR